MERYCPTALRVYRLLYAGAPGGETGYFFRMPGGAEPVLFAYEEVIQQQRNGWIYHCF